MLPSDFNQSSIKKNRLTKVSNSLIESFIRKNNLTALKIIFYIAKSDIKLPQGKLQTIIFNTEHLIQYCNMDIKTLKRNIKSMQETVITFVSFDDENRTKRIEENISVIPRSEYRYDGTFEIDMYKKILNLIVEVKNRFSIINVENLMKLKSKHSVRMIMLLEMIEGFNKKSKDENGNIIKIELPKRKFYTLDNLNNLFGTNYKNMYEFNRKILTPVKKELDEISRLSYLVTIKRDKLDTKAGRPKVVGVTIDLIKTK